MRLRDSVWAMLVQDETGTRDGVVALIRQAMLDAIDELSSPDVRTLDDTISRTVDIAGLWNLRSDLTNAIANEQGPEAARVRVNTITDMFGQY
jgi:hypothetical protein